MWRNVSWNSTDSNLPEGMHKHETGAYFKTPSIQSATSSQSGTEPKQQNEPELAELRPIQDTSRPQKPSASKRQCLRESQHRQPPIGNSSQAKLPASQTTSNSHGFRSRLSSISGALQHPKLAKRLFSHHQPDQAGELGQAPVQITTTSIDSPQHGTGPADEGPELKLSHSSSGRRLSQLFLPQLLNANNPMLIQDPYGINNELLPPHLLGLYGQPPLVGSSLPAGVNPATGARASWADISLFGRLSNVRPSIDSAFHSGQMRHSFDARKYSPISSLHPR